MSIELYDFLEKYYGIKLYPYQKVMLKIMSKLSDNLFAMKFSFRRGLYGHYRWYPKLLLERIPLYPEWMYLERKTLNGENTK